MTIKKSIEKIGEALIKDTNYKNYPDLVCDQSRGIIPRGLIFEDSGRDLNAVGSVIVGLNPGQSKKIDRAYFKGAFDRKALTYQVSVSFWNSKYRTWKYHNRLRSVSDKLGLKGPILWTELVKCQSKKRGILRVQTVRDDIHKYLLKEIAVIPESWPLIAGGNKAYEILSYSFPNRLVIGVPHPTGTFGGHWSNHINDKKIKILKNVIKKSHPVAIHTKDIE
ncbi:MAG: hypothetical protein AAB456_02180 [Patescibacteria group bacterium]